jgi:hypothetical protein
MEETAEETKVFERIDFLKCREELNELGITDKEINKALDDLGFTTRDLTNETGYKQEPTYIKKKNFLRNGNVHCKDYKGAYVKEYTVTGPIYQVSAQYQGLKHGDIIFKLLCNRYSWFDDFKVKKNYQESETESYFDSIGRLSTGSMSKEHLNMTVAELIALREGKKITKDKSAWDLYEMYGSRDYEMYLTTETGSLYVSLKAIIDKDWSVIDKRMKTYGMSYHDPKNLSGYALNHRGRSKEEYKKDKEEDYKKMIAPLKSKTAKLLKKAMLS